MSTQWSAVDSYIEQALIPHDEALEHALQNTAAAGLPAIQVAPNQGKLLMILAKAIQAEAILEIGTLGGYSTIWLARALPAAGSLVSLEADPKHADVARANVAAAGFGAMVDIRLGLALDTLPHLAAEVDVKARRPFDFIFIDADKANISAYFQWALKICRPGALIVTDNVVRDGGIIDATSTDPSIRGVRAFYENEAADPHVVTTAIQTVGAKGYDGFAISLVLTA